MHSPDFLFPCFLVFPPVNPSNFSHCKCFSIRIPFLFQYMYSQGRNTNNWYYCFSLITSIRARLTFSLELEAGSTAVAISCTVSASYTWNSSSYDCLHACMHCHVGWRLQNINKMIWRLQKIKQNYTFQ